MVVKLRFNYAICTGWCTNSDLVVTADGRVRWYSRVIGHNGPIKRQTRYLNPHQLFDFRARMNAIRPEHDADVPCESSDPLLVKAIWGTTVNWDDEDGVVQLRSCDSAEVSKTINDARTAIGIDS